MIQLARLGAVANQNEDIKNLIDDSRLRTSEYEMVFFRSRKCTFAPIEEIRAESPYPTRHAARIVRSKYGPHRGCACRVAAGVLRLDRRDQGGQDAAAGGARLAPRRTRVERAAPRRRTGTARRGPIRAGQTNLAPGRRSDP